MDFCQRLFSLSEASVRVIPHHRQALNVALSSHNNLRSFDPWTRFSYSAGWAVGSYFVPFVNLVVPYRAIREVWQKSRLPEDALLFETDPPRSFPIWWLFWLLASFAGNLSMRASFNENVSESTATMISIVASVLGILAVIRASNWNFLHLHQPRY